MNEKVSQTRGRQEGIDEGTRGQKRRKECMFSLHITHREGGRQEEGRGRIRNRLMLSIRIRQSPENRLPYLFNEEVMGGGLGLYNAKIAMTLYYNSLLGFPLQTHTRQNKVM